MTESARNVGDDERLMMEALSLATKAGQLGEVPVGAIVVSANGDVVGRGYNRPIETNDPTAHAEVEALRDAARSVGNYRLPGVTLFVTVEPCLMCLGAMIHARVSRVVFGCREPKSGALGSVFSLPDGTLNHRLSVQPGVCAEEATLLLQDFFRARRGA